MKKKLLSFALIGCIAFMASSWTLNEGPAKKTVLFEIQWDESYPIDGSFYNDCAGEVIDYSGTVNDMGTLTVYDDGSGHANFHYNYVGVTGVGQTTGTIYHWTGAGHLTNNFASASMLVINENGNVTAQGLGIVSTFKANVVFTVNANGELVRSNVGLTFECP